MLNKLFSPLMNLIVPTLCQSCGKLVSESEGLLCVSCRMDLPYSYDTLSRDNSAFKLLDGLHKIEWAGSLCYYRGSDNFSAMVRNIKYRSQRKIAYQLGSIFAGEIAKDCNFLDRIDVVVPVPLHIYRKLDRGYNQSDYIARGIADYLDCDIATDAVKRVVNNPNQARLHSHTDRMKNVENIFRVDKGEKLDNRHILIVDDVLTTGSTILSLIQAISDGCEGCRFSVATIARTEGSKT